MNLDELDIDKFREGMMGAIDILWGQIPFNKVFPVESHWGVLRPFIKPEGNEAYIDIQIFVSRDAAESWLETKKPCPMGHFEFKLEQTGWGGGVNFLKGEIN